jgi:hypothetical protein
MHTSHIVVLVTKCVVWDIHDEKYGDLQKSHFCSGS